MNRVLIYGDGLGLAELPLQLRFLEVVATATTCPETAKSALESGDFDAVIAPFREFLVDGPLIDVSAYRIGVAAEEDLKLVIAALGSQLHDCLIAPFHLAQLSLLFARTRLVERKRRPMDRQQDGQFMIVGLDGGLAKAWKTLKKVAAFDTDVLIEGESGTGKELFAQAIHARSGVSGPFVPINCAAIPPGLMESHLFGHVKGAFTDAHSDSLGVFRQADGGTLFLDEIGDFPLPMQVKLLRALQTGEIQPVGGEKPISVHVRLVSATSRHLELMVKRGEFREDLYYRLAVVPITLPPLRDRLEDLNLLIDSAIIRFDEKHHKSPHYLEEGARLLLNQASWPGNVRQLHNAIERLVILSEEKGITAALVTEEIQVSANKDEVDSNCESIKLNGRSLKDALRAVESGLLAEALQQCEGKRAQCAQLLQISPRTLLYKIKEHGLG